jgi:hypothetical protein
MQWEGREPRSGSEKEEKREPNSLFGAWYTWSRERVCFALINMSCLWLSRRLPHAVREEDDSVQRGRFFSFLFFCGVTLAAFGLAVLLSWAFFLLLEICIYGLFLILKDSTWEG